MSRCLLLLSLLGSVGCASTQVPCQRVLSGSAPFVTARRFVIRSHTDPWLADARRILRQTEEGLSVMVELAHHDGRDRVQLAFEPDQAGTSIAVSSWHQARNGERRPCAEAEVLEQSIIEILTTPDPGIDERLGTMLVSSSVRSSGRMEAP